MEFLVGELIAIGISVVWLLFLSWAVSTQLFRNDLPLARAIKTVLTAEALHWLLMVAALLYSPLFASLFRIGAELIISDVVAIAIAIFWEWRSFSRHWIDDDEVELE
ncbi:hypothetical protein [Sphingosinithalassobacter portus]|uniref:hypothetical protein n=1 Tax=Stakelama portus TaxID=2676234 RepID=UPI000D6DCDC2|nr:hypothetical protein [Sphingosinithalassobacter portus]